MVLRAVIKTTIRESLVFLVKNKLDIARILVDFSGSRLSYPIYTKGLNGTDVQVKLQN